MMRITFPKWHEDARRMRSAGMSVPQVADALHEAGVMVSVSRVYQVTSPNWRIAIERENVKFRARDRELEKAKKEGRLPDIKTAMIKALEDHEKSKKETEYMDRHFDIFHPEGLPPDNKNRVKISCSHNGCACSLVFARVGVIHPTHAANWFRDKGWYVGKTPRADLCPDHYHRDTKSPTPPEPDVPKAKVPKAFPVEAATIAPEDQSPPVVAAADTGAAMSRQDRRIVAAKLEEVYVDETNGYRKGWDDARVATDLGVEKAWVSAVRDEMFGPEFSGEDTEAGQLKQGIEEHYSLIAGHINNMRETMQAIDELSNELDGLMKKYRKLTNG